MFSRAMLALLCSGLVVSSLHAQSSGHAADPLLERVGTTIELDEKVYFGLFTRIRTDQFRGATLTPLAGDALHIDIQTTGGPETMELTRAETEALARYVGRYEALRFDPPSPDLVAAQEVVALGRIARPTLAFADPRQVTVALRDGSTERGWVLYADEQYLVLYDTGTPFDAQEFEIDAVAIAAPEIESVRLPGLPHRMLQVAEVGTVAALQVGLAYATYESRNSETVYGANAIAAPLTAASLYLLERSRLQSPYHVGGNRAAYLSLLRRIRPRVFFTRQVAPELRAWMATRPPVSAERFNRHERPLRHRIHVMISAPYSTGPEGGFTRNATARVNGRPSNLTQEGSAYVRNAAIGGEIVISPLAWLHVGAEAHRYQSLPGIQRASGFNVTQGSEVITRRQGWAAFAGVTLGDGTSRTAMSKVNLSGGIARREATLSGFLFSTLAMQSTPNNDPNTYRQYEETSGQMYPYARLMYDFFVTPLTSLSLKATYVPEKPLDVPEQSIETRFNANEWTVVQPAHAYSFSPVSLSLGLRLHF